MSTQREITITAEGCIRDYDVIKLAKSPRVTRHEMTLSTACGLRRRTMAKVVQMIPQPAKRDAKGRRVPQPPLERPVWADTVTGTLYCATTGRSSSPLLNLIIEQ